MANFAELKQHINTWSNDQEDLLIRKIRVFTENFNKKAEDINNAVKEIDDNINNAEITYFNNLNLLKNMSIRKYVEHTISNELLDFKKQRQDNQVAKSILSKEEKEHNLVEKFKVAIGISCENLNIKDLIDVKDDRDNNEDDNASVVTGSKYFQNMTKPSKIGVKLPLIIGQEAFFKKPNLGIVVEEVEINTDKAPNVLPEKQNLDTATRENNIPLLHDDERDRGKSFMSQIPNLKFSGNKNDIREVEKEVVFDNDMNNNAILTGEYVSKIPNITTHRLSNSHTANIQNTGNNNISNVPNVPLPNMGKLPVIQDIGVPKVVINVNKNAKVPSVPKIAIPIPKIPKSKPEADQNKAEQPEIKQEEVKPAKADFRSELFKRLNTLNKGGNSEINEEVAKISNHESHSNSNEIPQPKQNIPQISQPIVQKVNNQFKHSSTLNNNNGRAPSLTLLDDDDEEDGLFSGVKLPNKTNTKNIMLNNNRDAKKGLFEEIKEEEEEERFSAVSIKKKDIPQQEVKVESKPLINPISQTNQLNKKEKLIKDEGLDELPKGKQNNLQSKYMYIILIRSQISII